MRHQRAASELQPEVPRVAFEEGACVLDLGFAQVEVLVGDRGEVVEIVEIDVLERVDGGINVAWEGNIDQKKRSVGALLKCRSDHGTLEQ